MKRPRNPNEMLPMDEVLERLEELRQVTEGYPTPWYKVSEVWKWVWVIFEDIPPLPVRKFLLDLGFHYNGKRRVWQHCCGRPSTSSPHDPRVKYGERTLFTAVTQQEDEAPAAA